MKKYIRLVDYKDDEKIFEIETENIECIHYQQISGDEFITIIYKDGNIVECDSSDDRHIDFYDCSKYFTGKRIHKFIKEIEVNMEV